MIKHIKTILSYLIPILRQALLGVAADELTRAAYPRRSPIPYRPYTRYAHRPPRTEREAIRNVGRSMREAKEFRETNRFAQPFNLVDNTEYHDVLMVAFDIKGPDMQTVREWLQNNMPCPNAGGYVKHTVTLDDWWIADDDAGGDDRDSAVFVSKGKQERAREVLRAADLVE